jgi:N-acetylmuramoyl-L-alanine amidase
MSDLILFVLKSIVVSSIFTAWYFMALRNKRLHNYNRFFLLFILYASIQVPLLKFNWFPIIEKPPLLLNSVSITLHTTQESINQSPILSSAPAEHIDFRWMALCIMGMVSLILLARMSISIIRVLRKRKQYPISAVDGVTIVHTNLPNAPFSFLNFIFWKDSISFKTGYGKLILTHELAHVKQKHSYDKLVSQLLSAIFWINPFYWIIQREISIVHEFLADEQAIIHNSDFQKEDYTKTLAKMLLQTYGGQRQLTPEHHFYSSSIQRRIIMLKSNSNVRGSLLKRIMILPLIAASILLFAFSQRQTALHAKKEDYKKIILVVDAGHGGADEGCRSKARIEKNLTLKVARRIEQLASRYHIQVYLTRSEDKLMTAEERAAFSNKLQPDDFISIHVSDQPKGEQYLSTFDVAVNIKNEKVAESKNLAYSILKVASRPEWTQKNEFSEQGLYGLLSNLAPSALIAIGNINNQEQMQYIEDDKKLDELCSNILEGVLDAHR